MQKYINKKLYLLWHSALGFHQLDNFVVFLQFSNLFSRKVGLQHCGNKLACWPRDSLTLYTTIKHSNWKWPVYICPWGWALPEVMTHLFVIQLLGRCHGDWLVTCPTTVCWDGCCRLCSCLLYLVFPHLQYMCLCRSRLVYSKLVMYLRGSKLSKCLQSLGE